MRRWGSVRRVKQHRQIKWRGAKVAIGEALVGLMELARGDWLVRFAHVALGVVERRRMWFWRYGPTHPGRSAAPVCTENKTSNLSAMSPARQGGGSLPSHHAASLSARRACFLRSCGSR